jgi:V8-like Glu-specific endopeptidase
MAAKTTTTLGIDALNSEMPSIEVPPTTGNGTNRHGMAAETEFEEPEGGFVLLNPNEVDREVGNVSRSETESLLEEPQLEEPGFEAVEENAVALDAIYASYPELLERDLRTTEIILGQDQRTRILNTTSFPWNAICALKITAANGSRYIGTGWLISPRTVITAGHCVYMHDQGGWPRSIEVIPGMNDAARPFGSGVATVFRSVQGWTQSKNRNYDYGAIILPNNFRPGARTGAFGFSVKDDAYLKAALLNLSGYPGDKGGNQQWFMAQKAKSVASRVITYEIDTMGGQSGSPVWLKIGNQRFAVGIHTNGASSGNSATRIVQAVYNNLMTWKAMGM